MCYTNKFWFDLIKLAGRLGYQADLFISYLTRHNKSTAFPKEMKLTFEEHLFEYFLLEVCNIQFILSIKDLQICFKGLFSVKNIILSSNWMSLAKVLMAWFVLSCFLGQPSNQISAIHSEGGEYHPVLVVVSQQGPLLPSWKKISRINRANGHLTWGL